MRPPQRVLVVCPRRIGDVLLATPLMRSVKAAWPGAEVHALVFRGTEAVLAGNPDLTAVWTVAERPTAGAHFAFLRGLLRRFDLALSVVPSDRSTLYAALAGRSSAGVIVDSAKHAWKKIALTRWVPFDDLDTHTVSMALTLANALGIPAVAEVVAGWTPADAATVRRALAPVPAGSRYAVLHPFPKFPYKQWQQPGWGELARWLRGQGLHVVLTGSPDAEERAYAASVARDIPGALDLSGGLTLPQVVCLIAGARLYAGPDTVVTHLAAALGVPTVALYGPTNPVKWGPWPKGQAPTRSPWARVGSQRRGNVALVQGAGSCVPCMLEGCERHTRSLSDCLQHMTGATVIDAARDLLATSEDRPAREALH